MHMRKEFGNVGGARFYLSPSNTFGTSSQVKWHPESQYNPNLIKYDITARPQRVGRLEDYQLLLGTKHFDVEDGLVAKRIDETPVYVVRKSPQKVMSVLIKDWLNQQMVS